MLACALDFNVGTCEKLALGGLNPYSHLWRN